MLSAEESYRLTIGKSEEIQTIDHLLVVEGRIREAIERGYFVAFSDVLVPQIAEKLGVELEEFGYGTEVQGVNMIDTNNQPLCRVIVNWRYLPRPSRVPVSLSY